MPFWCIFILEHISTFNVNTRNNILLNFYQSEQRTEHIECTVARWTLHNTQSLFLCFPTFRNEMESFAHHFSETILYICSINILVVGLFVPFFLPFVFRRLRFHTFDMYLWEYKKKKNRKELRTNEMETITFNHNHHKSAPEKVFGKQFAQRHCWVEWK